MNKTVLIIKREFLVRVKKKSFIVMSLLAPILMASLIIVPVLISDTDQQKRLIGVFETNTNFSQELEDSENIHFTIFDETEMNSFINNPELSDYYALLKIEDESYTIFSNQQISLNLRKAIEKQLEQISERNKLKNAGIDIKIIQDAKTKITINSLTADQITTIASLSGVQEFPMRVKCATMVWHTLLSEIEKK